MTAQTQSWKCRDWNYQLAMTDAVADNPRVKCMSAPRFASSLGLRLLLLIRRHSHRLIFARVPFSSYSGTTNIVANILSSPVLSLYRRKTSSSIRIKVTERDISKTPIFVPTKTTRYSLVHCQDELHPAGRVLQIDRVLSEEQDIRWRLYDLRQ